MVRANSGYHSGANASELAHGSFSGGLDHKANRNGDRLEVKMRPVNDFMNFPFFGPNSQLGCCLERKYPDRA